ncbi:MAG: cytochrome P460 family protein [Arenicella sp.]|nr:cytochrome P460 family protein [Arenicella sp.]
MQEKGKQWHGRLALAGYVGIHGTWRGLTVCEGRCEENQLDDSWNPPYGQSPSPFKGKKMKFRIIISTAIATALTLSAWAFQGAEVKTAQQDSTVKIGAAEFTLSGELIQPTGYREWIYVGTPLTPNDMNNGHAAFPDFHHVYIDPVSWAHYNETGEFREGTTIIKELVDVGSKNAVSGSGYFMGDFIGLEATIKSKKQFPNEPGNWAYFSFGHKYPLAKKATAFPAQACNSCHEASAADDFVFTQYYPVLREGKGKQTKPVAWEGPKLNEEGELLRPEGYRDWVMVGTPLTPHDMNNGNATFPEFHTVYIDRPSWEQYKETGKFQEGTTLVKELISVGSKAAVSGSGYFMGDFIGLEATVKSKNLFPDEPGNWAYFSYGHEYPLKSAAEPFLSQSCNSCHQNVAADDFVFTQYYPVLRDAKGSEQEETHDGENCEHCQEALRSMKKSKKAAEQPGSETPIGSVGEIPLDKDELFQFLTEGKYKDFAASESIHPSAGPHSIKGTYGEPVRAFLNQVMVDSLNAGNADHPKGAAIVKEMFNHEGTALEGWAVTVKTQEDSDNGKGWFWYEVTSTTDADALVANGNGVGLCYSCHSIGNDYVRTNWPLK